jgi:hypothetical protein
MIQLDQALQVAATGTALVVALAAYAQNRRKPKVDESQVEVNEASVKHTLVTSDTVRGELRKMNDQFNLRRDLELADFRTWAYDQTLPWYRLVQQRWDEREKLICDMAAQLDRQIEPIHLPDFPQPPPPRPLS